MELPMEYKMWIISLRRHYNFSEVVVPQEEEEEEEDIKCGLMLRVSVSWNEVTPWCACIPLSVVKVGVFSMMYALRPKKLQCSLCSTS